MENERREDSSDQPVTPQVEASGREERPQPEEHIPSYAPEEIPRALGESPVPPEGGPAHPSNDSAEMRGRGGPRRGRRPPPRDRRGRGGGRGGRDPRGHFQPQHSHLQHGPRVAHGPVEAPRSEPSGDAGSPLQQAKAELDRVREALEMVLRDLDDVSNQLTKAEHEKDLAEAEIEQLRESLRRLHR